MLKMSSLSLNFVLIQSRTRRQKLKLSYVHDLGYLGELVMNKVSANTETDCCGAPKGAGNAGSTFGAAKGSGSAIGCIIGSTDGGCRIAARLTYRLPFRPFKYRSVPSQSTLHSSSSDATRASAACLSHRAFATFGCPRRRCAPRRPPDARGRGTAPLLYL